MKMVEEVFHFSLCCCSDGVENGVVCCNISPPLLFVQDYIHTITRKFNFFKKKVNIYYYYIKSGCMDSNPLLSANGSYKLLTVAPFIGFFKIFY